MGAMVFNNIAGGLIRFAPELLEVPDTIVGTISGATACAGCFADTGTGFFYKVNSGTINGTFSLVREFLPSGLRWTATIPGVSVGQFTDSACTTPSGRTLLATAHLSFSCFTRAWLFFIGAADPFSSGTGLWHPDATQNACDVVGNSVAINNPNVSCSTASVVNGLFNGGSVAISLCA